MAAVLITSVSKAICKLSALGGGAGSSRAYFFSIFRNHSVNSLSDQGGGYTFASMLIKNHQHSNIAAQWSSSMWLELADNYAEEIVPLVQGLSTAVNLFIRIRKTSVLTRKHRSGHRPRK